MKRIKRKRRIKKPILKLIGVDGNVFIILGTARKIALENNMG